ncbi:hypothetical protein SUGI_0077330 [Cryptomeria japonica]|nr:hypothetical protein SUGI_0077330 [Cryptomeria japonica]
MQKTNNAPASQDEERPERVSLILDNQSWTESVAFFKAQGLFLKYFGDWPSVGKVKGCYAENWNRKLELKTLPNGFFVVIIENEKDKQWILNSGPFFWGGRGLYIRHREPNFNLLQALIEELPIWLRLYSLPREYKNEESFQAIGNKLGFYIKVDEAIESKDFKIYA